MIYYILIFLFSLDFYSKGSWILLIVLFFSVLHKKKIKIAADFLILCFFSISYIAFKGFNGGSIAYSALFYPLAFFAGSNFRECSIDIKDCKKLLLCLSVGMAMHSMLNLAYEIMRTGGVLYGGVHYDIWSSSVSSVTGQMTNYTLLSAWLSSVILFRKKYLWLIPFLIISFLHTIIVGGRTYLVLLVISLVIGISVQCIVENRRLFKNLIGVFGVIVLLSVICIIMYKTNFLGIQKLVKSSYLYHRLYSDYAIKTNSSFFKTGRWEKKLEYISLMLDYPWGGNKIRSSLGYYAHDLWIDIYDGGGIVAFFLFLIYSLRMIKRCINVIKNPYVQKNLKVLLGSFICVVLAQFFVEPVMSSAPIFLMSVCLFDGYLYKTKNLYMNKTVIQQ